jgi:neutral ceramidase
LKKFLKYTLIFFMLLTIAIRFVFIEKIDSTPYPQTSAYVQTMLSIDEMEAQLSNGEPFMAGWAKVNLLPPFQTPIAIDAARKGKLYESVRDSIYVRTFVFKKGETKIAYISADLLIIPPLVVQILDTLLGEKGYSKENIYYTATHTHTSIGAWHNSFVGEIFAGKYDDRIPKHIAQVFTQSIEEAEKKLRPTQVGTSQISTSQLVVNRLVGDDGKVDTMMRIMKLMNDKNEEALLFSFTAHATVFHENVMQISGDWPGETLAKIAIQKPDLFAVFSAGAVGSHGPFEHSKNQQEELEYMAEGAANLILKNADSIEVFDVENLSMVHLPVSTKSPHFRVSKNYAIRPFWFNKLFGDAKLHVIFLQIGNNFFAGMPCDFSGELTYEIEPYSSEVGCNLFITSFNGAYAGYITDDRWYNLDEYETRTMAWLGKGNGKYFSEIIIHSFLKIYNKNEQQ